MVVSAILAPNYRTGATANAPVMTEEAVKAAIFDSQKAEYETKLDDWIEGLVQLESEGRSNFKILDVNGKYSYSCLQFQMGTFKAFYPLLNAGNGSKLTAAGWEKEIMACYTQKMIAKAMIKSNHNAWRHWYNSVKKRGLGLPPVPPIQSS